MKVSVPAGVSAIFEPFILTDPFCSGARGAGIGAKGAVTVEVRIKHSDMFRVRNVINGKEVSRGVGETAVKLTLEFLKVEEPLEIEIKQEVRVPIAAGFGTSAASALGIVLALSGELGRPLSIIQAADIAHIAEILSGTGLGTAAGLAFPGDIVVVAKPGPPSSCLIDHILVEGEDIFVVMASVGRVETSVALKDPSLIEKASKLGKIGVDKILKECSVEAFFKVVNWFSSEIGLRTPRISQAIQRAVEAGAIGAAQAMIGDSIFALAYKEDVEEVKKALEEVLGVQASALELVRLGYSIKR